MDYRVRWQTTGGALRDAQGGAIKPGTYETAAVLKAGPELWSAAVSFEVPAK
jgi:hypothetical protein